MADITTRIDYQNDLTVHTIVGTVTLEEIITVVKDYYRPEKITRLILWDITRADMSAVFGEELRKIVKQTKDYAYGRDGGKTALVAPDDLGFGLGRTYEALVEIEGFPFEYRVFREMPEALVWLGVSA